MVMVSASLQEMNASQCNVSKSDVNTTVCVCSDILQFFQWYPSLFEFVRGSVKKGRSRNDTDVATDTDLITMLVK